MRKQIYGIVGATLLTLAVSSSASSSLPAEFLTETPEVEILAEEPTALAKVTAGPLLPAYGIRGRMSPAEINYAILHSGATLRSDMSESLEEDEETVEDDGISMENVEYVAELIESEAGNVNSFEGRVSVALTAFKRVESGKYPDTLHEVVEQPWQYADLVGRYSAKSYQAAVKAIRLWEDGIDDTVLPDGYLFFFGYNQQNWFYRYLSDGSIEFYALPGQTITDDVWQAFREIVLKEVPVDEAEEEVQEEIEQIEEILEETIPEEDTTDELASEAEETEETEVQTEEVTISEPTTTDT